MDLSSQYMGLRLRNPLIGSSVPLGDDLGTLRALEDHGAGAVVLPSIFEELIAAEQAEYERRLAVPARGSAEAQTYFPQIGVTGPGPERHLALVRRAKAALDIPVIGSLCGVTLAGWGDYAEALQQAGVDAIELNMHFVPTDLTLSGRDVEQRYLQVISTVKGRVGIPIAVKIGPYFSAPGSMALALAERGADALVLFNRFHQPDIDIGTLRLSMDVELSSPRDMGLPLLWIAILHGRVPASLAASSGVDCADDVYKYLLAGADAVMTTSALLRHGVKHIGQLTEGLRALLDARGFQSVAEIRGRMSQENLPDPASLGRSQYMPAQGYHLTRPG